MDHWEIFEIWIEMRLEIQRFLRKFYISVLFEKKFKINREFFGYTESIFKTFRWSSVFQVCEVICIQYSCVLRFFCQIFERIRQKTLLKQEILPNWYAFFLNKSYQLALEYCIKYRDFRVIFGLLRIFLKFGLKCG